MQTGTQIRKSTEGYTLIELVIVLTIIAILAAVLFPVFKAARVRAGATSCGSNLHQLYQAVAMYAADYSGYIPPYTTSIEKRPGIPLLRTIDRSKELIGALHPYTKSSDIWFCSADPYARTSTSVAYGTGISRPVGVNHQLTSYITSDWWYGPFSRVKRLFNPVLGATPLDVSWWDENQKRGGETSDTLLMDDMLDDCGLPHSQETALYSHGERYNFVYFDGHSHFGCWK